LVTFAAFQEFITILGRKKGDNELEVNSKYVSRFHGRLDLKKKDDNEEIWYKVNSFTILTFLQFQDLGSSSGSRINGKPVAEQKLRRGDQLIVGKTVMIFLGNTLWLPRILTFYR
jgi:pSer/pThr/pTyr-binding forkhead associated (FHA) protein